MTHVSVAVFGSSLLATLYLGAELIRPDQLLILATAGTLGGILPDIDSDKSLAIRVVFMLFAVLAAFLAVFSLSGHYSILELWAIWIGCYLLVRYVVPQLFVALTVHRGIFHSLSAAVFFWFTATAACYHLLGMDSLFSWHVGLFVFIGFIIHLLLDELYSVDLTNARIKRSFGTALKLTQGSNLTVSTLMLAAVMVMFVLTPAPDRFFNLLMDAQTWQTIAHHFFPKQGVFPQDTAG